MVEELDSPVSFGSCHVALVYYPCGFHVPLPALQRLRKLWRELLEDCKRRVDCNTDEGDYSGILKDLDKVIGKIAPKEVVDDKRFNAKTLKCILKTLYRDVQGYTRNGHAGVASVLYNKLSGLAGSSVIRRVGKALRDTAGKSRSPRGGGAGGRSDVAYPSAPQTIGRRGFSNSFEQRGRSFGGRFPRNMRGPYKRGFLSSGDRPVMRCFTCHKTGHGYQQCPESRDERPPRD